MESEPRQNPLSKDKTIEQLQTTIGKLETIIEQLNSTSVVNPSATNSVETLITTTEELETAISNLSEETVETESETIIKNEEVLAEDEELNPIPSQEQVVTSESETALEEETPTPEIKVTEVPAAQPSVPEVPQQKKTVVQNNINQSKPDKKKKQKNWIAIAIIALIIAIIPISLKYLPFGFISSNTLSTEPEETIIQTTTDIASKLTSNQFDIPKENIVTNEIVDQAEDINLINDLPPILENDKITEVEIVEEFSEEASEVANTPIDLTTEASNNSNLEQSFSEEKNISNIALKSDLEVPKVDQKLENIAISNNLDEEITKLREEPQLLLDTDAIANQKLDDAENNKLLIIDDIPEAIVEPEPQIIVPENLIAENPEQVLDLKTLIHDVKLTPEQNLIALLSEKVLQFSQDSQDNIVLSIEPNIKNNILTVKITDDWYSLAIKEQDEIVANMFVRSQELEFRKLEIKDQNDNLVARSPVVGQNMIIFRRDY